MLPQLLISASAAIVLTVGTLHLVYTFFGPKLRPRDPELEARMKEVSPVITSQTTMWKTWIGFNASHSLGLMLFGVLYGYLSIFQFQVLLQARFLLLVGAIFLVSFLVLAKRYFFRIPLACIASSLVLYVVGVAAAVV